MKKKLIRWTVRGLLIVVTLVVFFYAEENWRGGRAWKKLESQLREKGEPLTLAEIIPPEVPDNLNMAMAPVWKEVFTADELKKKGGDVPKPRINSIKLSSEKEDIPQSSSIRKGESVDLKAWAVYLGAAEKDAPDAMAMRGLKTYFAEKESLVAEVSDSLRLPYKRWPLRYEDGISMSLPHLGITLDVANYYKLRALFYLSEGKEKEACDDLETLWLLSDSFKPETSLISSLVAIALSGIGQPVIWEGLAQHKWSPASLEKIKKYLENERIHDHLVTGLRGERGAFLNFIPKVKAKDLVLMKSMSEDESSLWSEKTMIYLYAYLRPAGWMELDKVLYADAMQKGIEWNEQVGKEGYLPPDYLQVKERLGSGSFSAFQRIQAPLSFLALPAIWSSIKKFAEMESFQKLTLVACSIEQYRLATGRLPESLEDLVPAYLKSVPVDIMNGQSFRYVKKGGDDYLLYSIGWNGTDDGGVTTKDRDSGDWVWPSRAGLVEVIGK